MTKKAPAEKAARIGGTGRRAEGTAGWARPNPFGRNATAAQGLPSHVVPNHATMGDRRVGGLSYFE